MNKINSNLHDNNQLLSIVMVTFNAELTLRRAITSVRNTKQSYVKFIVIDGASNDKTLGILHENADVIDFLLSEKDEGIYDAMNKAWLNVLNGSYVLFIGADDEVLSLPSQILLQEMSKMNVDLFFGDVLIQEKLFKSKFDWRIVYRNTIHHQSMFLRKKQDMNLLFNKTFKIYGDWDLNQKMYQQGISFARVDNVFTKIGAGGVSAIANYKEIYKVVNSNFGFLLGLVSLIYHKVF